LIDLEKFIVYHVVKVRIIFCRLSKLVNPFKDFYNQVTNPHYNATTDVYATMFFCDYEDWSLGCKNLWMDSLIYSICKILFLLLLHDIQWTSLNLSILGPMLRLNYHLRPNLGIWICNHVFLWFYQLLHCGVWLHSIWTVCKFLRCLPK
jgi:hypothetical protein